MSNEALRTSSILVPGARTVSMRIFKHLGAVHESGDKRGLTHAVEHMCFRGSKKFPTDRDVEMAAHDMGATLNACTTHQGICFRIDAPDYEARAAFDLLMDLVARPRLLPEAWKTEKNVILEEIATRDNISDAVAKLVFGDDWPSRAIIGLASHVRKFAVEDIRSWHARMKSAPTSVVLAGRAAVIETLPARSENSPRELFKTTPSTTYSRKRCVSVISGRDASGVELAFPLRWQGFMHGPGIRLAAAKIYASMLKTRLFEQCRSKKGLVYSIDAWLEYFDDVQCVHVTAEVSEKNIVPLTKEILRLLEGADIDLANSEALFKASCKNLAATAYMHSVSAEEAADHEIWSLVLQHHSDFIDELQGRYQYLGEKPPHSILPTLDRRFGPYVAAAVEGGDAVYMRAEARKERGVYFVLRENGAGADQALDQLAEEMAALQVERMCFRRSLVRSFHRVGSCLGLFLGPLLLILLHLDRFERVRLALTSVLLISLLVDIYVGRVRLKQEARGAAILDRFRFFQSIVRTVPIQNGEKP